MKTYQIDIKTQGELTLETETVFIKSDAESFDVQQAIDFVKKGEKYVDRLLQALRVLGFKAQEVKINPVDIFEA